MRQDRRIACRAHVHEQAIHVRRQDIGRRFAEHMPASVQGEDLGAPQTLHHVGPHMRLAT